MNMPPGFSSERAFVEAILVELAGGQTLFGRDDVKTLIGCYRRECDRFDALAMDIAYHLHEDKEHLGTYYGEFTKSLPKGRVSADVFRMRDQIDQDDDYTGKESDDAA